MNIRNPLDVANHLSRVALQLVPITNGVLTDSQITVVLVERYKVHVHVVRMYSRHRDIIVDTTKAARALSLSLFFRLLYLTWTRLSTLHAVAQNLPDRTDSSWIQPEFWKGTKDDR